MFLFGSCCLAVLDASEEGLCKYLYMSLHMRTRHIGAKQRLKDVARAAVELEVKREREGERGSARTEENRGGRETERATGEKKTWTGKTGDGGRARLLRHCCVFAHSTGEGGKKRDLFLTDLFF